VVDLLLGLIEPTEGRIVIDGTPLTPRNVRAWQRNIGYVPQSIFLADSSVAENIAFAIAPEAIDMAAVERAARIANIHDFVAGALPGGYATTIGERGVRLSGGQRQRIGIARALYHDPSLLVFDEATSALDNATEAAVMEAIGRLHGQKTMVIVAHRHATLQGCDRVYDVAHGRVRAVTLDTELRIAGSL
jgi:ATP-binding cassette, subfamily B, bacterial PglK